VNTAVQLKNSGKCFSSGSLDMCDFNKRPRKNAESDRINITELIFRFYEENYLLSLVKFFSIRVQSRENHRRSLKKEK